MREKNSKNKGTDECAPIISLRLSLRFILFSSLPNNKERAETTGWRSGTNVGREEEVRKTNERSTIR